MSHYDEFAWMEDERQECSYYCPAMGIIDDNEHRLCPACEAVGDVSHWECCKIHPEWMKLQAMEEKR